MGGDGAWDHINSCIHHNANWTTAHEHVLQALERICNDAGFASRRQRVLASEGGRRADLEIRNSPGSLKINATAREMHNNVSIADKFDLLIDVALRHDFIGTGRSGLTQGQLRNPDNPDHILESAAADKIRNYCDTYQRNRQVAFLPACMSTSGRILGEFLRLLFFLSNKQADDYCSGYEAHKEKFCHRRSVLPPQPVHHRDGMCSGCGVAWRLHHSSSPRPCPSPPAALTPRRR
jgi:hypothetical protein